MSSDSDGQRIDRLELQSLVDSFPPVVHSFGYGSGVFEQSNNNEGMIDLILVVDNAQDWHALNLQQNPTHYATIPKLLGAPFCARLQRVGPGVYFHAGVRVNDRIIKYGVVESNMLQKDLQCWTYVYLAGRLHKPTVCISRNEQIMNLQEQHNLPAALSASLLLLLSSETNKEVSSKRQIPLDEVYHQIAQLSYAGDFRVAVGAEDPHKIHKLVHSTGQFQRFQDLYKQSLSELEQCGLVSMVNNSMSMEYSCDERTRFELSRRLPLRFQSDLSSALQQTVARAARAQSVKGVVTVGIVKSAHYALAKLSKGLLKKS